MSHGGFYIPRLFKYLPRELEGKTVLDAGFGLGEVAYYIHAFTGRPACDFRGHPHITGVDIYEPSVRFAREWLPKIYDEVHCFDLLNLKERFGGRHFDVALMLEVTEHIEKSKALRVLDQVEELADYVLVATPLGDELNRDYGDEIPEFNHVSVWTPEDFTRRGYTVSVEDVTPNTITSRTFRRLYHGIRIVVNGSDTVQRKIIAVRNKKGVEVSGGLSFGGLKG